MEEQNQSPKEILHISVKIDIHDFLKLIKLQQETLNEMIQFLESHFDLFVDMR
jgi:hypothetical protein